MGFNPQAQMQSDAAMQPGDAENGYLADAGRPRIGNPDVDQDVPMDPVNVEIAVYEADPDGMLNDQDGDQQPECEAQCLDPPHPQMPADIDRPEREREMDREGAVEQDCADLAAPD